MNCLTPESLTSFITLIYVTLSADKNFPGKIISFILISLKVFVAEGMKKFKGVLYNFVIPKYGNKRTADPLPLKAGSRNFSRCQIGTFTQGCDGYR